MADGFAGDIVFGELVHEFAGENEIEEIVHVSHERQICGVLPGFAPESREDLNIGQQRAIAISKLRRSRCGGAGSGVQRYDAQRMLEFAARTLAGFRLSCSGHETLLCGCPMS